MDQSRGKQHHSLKSYKSSTLLHNLHHENSSYSMSTNPGIFKSSRLQRHSLKWRKDYHYRGNYRSKGLHKKTDFTSRKSSRTAEEIEEEERKKKLNDTAKKLLMKLKNWNAEKNCSNDSQSTSDITQAVSETSCKHNEDKINSENLLKKTAHSKKGKLLTNRSRKSFSQPKKSKYEVNKETVKDFQNRIQHKLIEEIMQMPKESLQNVLNDPKINPIMELKMTRLVQENKLVIASKLRALAESKMKSLDSSTNPQLFVDIDKLIDPVIETDLSVLPFELIKQMENVFQVQFDYSHESASSQSVNDSGTIDAVLEEDDSGTINALLGEDNSGTINTLFEEDVAIESNNLEPNIKVENSEDLSFYECSTDEDEEVSTSAINFSQKKILNESRSCKKNKKVKLPETFKPPSEFESLPLPGNTEKESFPCEPFLDKSSDNTPFSQFFPQITDQKTFTKKFISTTCQTECSSQDAFTQTLEEVKTLYGVPLPKETTDDCLISLQGEANAIQNLINKLNERRLMIFLQMARMSPSGSFLSDDSTKKNFIESASNGSLNLVESLKQYFNNHKEKTFSRNRNFSWKRKNEYKKKFRGEKRNNQNDSVKTKSNVEKF